MPAKDAGAGVRLFVLGTLEARGSAHGHELRRLAERIDADRWSEAGVGSVYNAIRRLEAEQLIAPVRTERHGRRPTRTLYRLTDAGRAELDALRDRLLHQVRLGSDPFDIALWVSSNQPTAALEQAIEERRSVLTEQLRALAAERRRLTEAGALPTVAELLFRHGEVRLDAELRWHEELRQRLPELPSRREEA